MKKPTKRSRGRRFGLNRAPRKPKTYADVAQLQKAEFHLDENTGVRFSVEPVENFVFMGDLLGKFYNRNEEQLPLVFRLTEDQFGPIQGIKFWQAVMRGSFFLEIEQNNDAIEGPHACKLFFRNFTPPIKMTWLASVQIMAFYFNEEQMKAALCEAVNKREFFMLPENQDMPVTL